jgi:uncharacterized protein involved in exopolysaccharide biosynthesis
VLSTSKLALRIILSRWVVLAGVALACLAGAVAYALLGPEPYPATATLFIDPGPLDGAAGDARASGARASGLDLLRSERVAQRVVENERLVEEPALRRLYLDSIDAGNPPVEAIAQYIAEHVDPSAAADGSVVRLTVSLNEPHLSARVANAYAQAWGEVSLELRAASIRDGVERADQDLASLRARLGEARARRGNGAALAAAGSRADEQFAQISRLSAEQGAALPPAQGPGGQRASDWVRDLDLPVDPLPGARLDASASDQGARDSAARAQQAVRAAGADSGAGAERGASASSADDEIRLAQQSLERAEDRLARLAAEGIGAPFPAHLLRAARPADVSSKPPIGVCAALGLALGLVMGLLAVWLAERFDRRVRRPADVARALGIVVLGDLPADRQAARGFAGAGARRWLRLQRA